MKPFMQRVSLAQVAKSTGFAVSTVSMALRNTGTICPETRQKIQDAARRLGYHPNPLLASLASKHFGSGPRDGIPVAFIYDPGLGETDEAIAKEIFQPVHEHGFRMGYRIERFKVTDFRGGAHATQVLFSRGFQGIVLSAHFRMETFSGMDWNRFSVVAWGERLAGLSNHLQPLLYRATVNHFEVVLRAWEETRKRGYKKIGFALIRDRENFRDDQLRIAAAQFCLQEVAPRFRVPLLVRTMGNDFDYRPFGQWVRRHQPDAVIGFNPVLHWALRNQGFRIPEDFGFAVLHRDLDMERLLGTDVDFSGMREMRGKSILAAIELLDQQIRHHQCGLSSEPRVLMLDPEWIDGDTLPPKVAASSRPRRRDGRNFSRDVSPEKIGEN